MKHDWRIFTSSVFFVLGFSVVFSLLGVLLQTVLSSVGYTVQTWLARIGGVIIILFGLFLLGLFKPRFLTIEHKLRVTRKFKSHYLASFVFGAAFAVGWTPCVTAALGAILALAATQSASAFILLMTYTLGLGVPFLLVGLFTEQAKHLIDKAGRFVKYLEYVFGVVLIVLGVFVFTNQLARISGVPFLVNLFGMANVSVGGADIMSLSLLNLGIAFSAGLVSFLSPCVLPIIPGFLSYLATAAVKKEGALE
ncbi:sulfite exporter TauE/SafE family protein [Candidatus Woesearchaeota archaeon]|nr:sulfite exporter TauE/SafE family protein [Candidatus Woesearchaeota archaeon]